MTIKTHSCTTRLKFLVSMPDYQSISFPSKLLALCLIVSSPSSASVLVMPDTATSQDLGRGFIDSTKTIAPGCITGTIQKQLIENLKLEYSAGEDAENTLMALSGRVLGSVNLLVAGASAGYQFVQSKTDDENGLSSFINVTYERARLKLAKPSLTTLGLSAIKKSPAEVLATCGASAIDEAVIGARLSIVVRFVYVGSRDYKYSKAKVKTEALGATISKKTKVSESEEISKSFVLNVDAYQFGGNQGRLKSILQGRRYCALYDVDGCSATYKELIRYAQSGFRDSIKASDENSLSVLRLISTPYSDLPIGDLFPKFEMNNASSIFKNSAMRHYRKVLAERLKKKEQIEAKLQSGVLGGDTENKLENELLTVNDEIKHLSSKIDQCDFAAPNDSSLCEF